MDSAHYSSFVREEANFEIARLEQILRDPASTEQDREIAASMLNFYRATMDEHAFWNAIGRQDSARSQSSRQLRKKKVSPNPKKTAA